MQPPSPTSIKNQFSLFQSTRSVFTGSTQASGNSLILFNFSNHGGHHRQNRFGQRFGIEKLRESACENSLQIFNLRAIKTRVPCTVNP